jgi:hypothetical protein
MAFDIEFPAAGSSQSWVRIDGKHLNKAGTA